MSNRTCNPFPCECCHQVVKSTHVVIKSSTLFVKVKTMRLLRHENSQRHIFLKTNHWPYLFPGSSENHLRFIVTVVAPRYRKHLDGVELVPVLCTCVLFLWDLAASPTAGFGFRYRCCEEIGRLWANTDLFDKKRLI